MLTKLRLKFAFYRLKLKLKSIRDKVFTPDSIMSFLFSKEASLITPWQFVDEYKPLLESYAAIKPKYAIEIGTANGGTLFSLCKLSDNNATIISCDLPGGKFGGGYPDWKNDVYKSFSKSGQKLHLIKKNSQAAETFEEIKKILNGNLVDYLFIDGDHTYNGIKNDFKLYEPLVRKGGIIAFHDIVDNDNPDCKVDVFWREIKGNYSVAKEFLTQPRQRLCGIGVIYKE